MEPVPLVETRSCLRAAPDRSCGVERHPHSLPRSDSLRSAKRGGAAHTSLPELQTRSPAPSGASRAGGFPAAAGLCGLSPPTPTRGSPSLPPSSPADQSAHTGAPARGRAGGGGCCCRCRSPSPSLRDRPPCCGLCGHLRLSVWPEPSLASRRSSGGEENGAWRRGSAGWGEQGFDRGVPAIRRRQPCALTWSLLQPLPGVPGRSVSLRSF